MTAGPGTPFRETGAAPELIHRVAAFLALAIACGAASLAAAAVLTWVTQRELWGFDAYPEPSGVPGFAVAGLAAGRILLIVPFDGTGEWGDDPGTGSGVWFGENRAEIPCPVAAAEAALAAFEAEHATALEGFEVYLVEAVVLVTAATITDAEALAADVEDRTGGRVVLTGLRDRGDGLPRLDATIQRADQALAVREDLAGYVRRNIA